MTYCHSKYISGVHEEDNICGISTQKASLWLAAHSFVAMIYASYITCY